MVCLYVCTEFFFEKLIVHSSKKFVVKNGGFESLIAGMRKSYWITCKMTLHNVLVDQRTVLSHPVVKPQDFSRQLTHFQTHG